MKILIYQDYVHNNATLYRALCRQFGMDNVHFADAADIAGGALRSTIKLLVMPGGADLYYTEKLKGDGDTAIRNYIENGGSYLGICAGSYYACTDIEWAKETTHKICEPRALAFFPGKAVGPVTEFIEDNDPEKSWHAAPEVFYDDGHYQMEAHVHYAGGPVFVPAENEGFTVLAKYVNGENAIVECSVGAGKAILCSPHLEKTYDDIMRGLYRHKNNSYEWEQKSAEALRSSETQARRLWAHILLRSVGTRKKDAA